MFLFSRKTPGFTLIEVMVALAILGIGIVALLGAHRMALAHQQNALVKKWGLFLAEEKLQEIRQFQQDHPAGGEVLQQNQVYCWQSRKRAIQPGLSEWSVSVQWENPKKQEVVLTTWVRDKKYETE